MTEQTEWRHGDVSVIACTDGRWWLVAGRNAAGKVDKDICPDPQALAEFVDSQQPKPRYEVRQVSVSGNLNATAYPFRVIDHKLDREMVAGSFDVRIAKHLADWLNAQEATDA